MEFGQGAAEARPRGRTLRERVLRVVREPEMTAGSHGGGPAEVAADELAGLRFFESVPRWTLERLAGSAAKRRLEQGATVVRKNDEARAVYFLLSGAVQVLVYFEGVGDLLMGCSGSRGASLGGQRSVLPIGTRLR